MKALISKLQYVYFEEGEFDDIKDRTYEETMLYIRQFPWDAQRTQVKIGLDGPSVTIEDGEGNYLKLGVDYHSKFILYYLSKDNCIYCQLGGRLEDFESTIYSFFTSGVETSKLNKYRDWLSWRTKQFATQSFEYSFGIKRFLAIMFLPVFLGLGMFMMIAYQGSVLSSVVFAVGMQILFFTVNWVLFFNYYLSTSKVAIKVSRGKDDFYFGKRNGTLKKYSKEDIIKITTFSNIKWRKCPWSEFYIYKIQLKDGTVIEFSNFALSWFKLNSKFPNQTVQEKHMFIPLIRKAK